MKIIIKIIISIILVFFGVKLLLPYHLYPIENFEYKLVSFLPISWKTVAILSRIIVGIMFSIAFLLVFDLYKLKWAKYVAIILLFIPFAINSVFIENFVDSSIQVNKKLAFELKNLEEGNNILIYSSNNCHHCKETIKKLKVASQKNKYFPNVIVIGYNTEISNFLKENDIAFKLDSISAKQFMEQTKGSFPVLQMVKNKTIIKKWSNYDFNYAVLDKLEK